MKDASSIFEVTKKSGSIISSKTLTDDEKESLARKLSLEVLCSTAMFCVKIALLFAVSLLLLFAGSFIPGIEQDSIYELMLSWKTLVLLVIVVFAYSKVRHVK